MKSLYDIRILFKRLNFDFLKKIRKKKHYARINYNNSSKDYISTVT